MKWFCTSTRRVGVICLVGLALTVGGCLNIAVQLTPENPQVPKLRETSDCVPMILGFAYGTATVEGALAEKAFLINNYNAPEALISKVRSVASHYYYFLLAGAWCVEVTGE